MRRKIFVVVLLVLSALTASAQVGIVAHRGYWNCEESGYARNSVAALRSAQQYGFWGSEFDLNMTSDEVILVFHDGKIDGKVIEENPYSVFSDYTLENGEKIPTLDDYLTQALVNPKVVLVCEFKTHSTPELEDRLVELTVAKLGEYGLYDPSRVIFISFSRHICDLIARTMPQFTNQYLGDEYSPDNLSGTSINGIDFNYKNFSSHPEWIGQARNHGMSVNCWTVNKTEKMKEMIDLGVDFITTDHPAVLRGLLKELGIEEK